MGGPRIVIVPMMTVRIAITMATIGRLMKNSDILQLPPGAVLNGTGVTVLPALTF